MAKCGNKQHGYFQSCDSCEEYVTCVHGIKYDRTCPDGLKWNDAIKRCDRTTPTCKERKKPQTNGCVEKCGNKVVGYFQSCDSCERYVVCIHGIKYDRSCPDGRQWNDTTKSCERTTPTCHSDVFLILNLYQLVIFYKKKANIC